MTGSLPFDEWLCRLSLDIDSTCTRGYNSVLKNEDSVLWLHVYQDCSSLMLNEVASLNHSVTLNHVNPSSVRVISCVALKVGACDL